jgi:hypothetical protein
MDQAFPLPLVKFCSSAFERDIASVSIANHSYKKFFSGAGFTTDSNFKHSLLRKLGSSVGAILIGQAGLFSAPLLVHILYFIYLFSKSALCLCLTCILY